MRPSPVRKGAEFKHLQRVVNAQIHVRIDESCRNDLFELVKRRQRPVVNVAEQNPNPEEIAVGTAGVVLVAVH